jgi:hypothetical protein
VRGRARRKPQTVDEEGSDRVEVSEETVKNVAPGEDRRFCQAWRSEGESVHEKGSRPRL